MALHILPVAVCLFFCILSSSAVSAESGPLRRHSRNAVAAAFRAHISAIPNEDTHPFQLQSQSSKRTKTMNFHDAKAVQAALDLIEPEIFRHQQSAADDNDDDDDDAGSMIGAPAAAASANMSCEVCTGIVGAAIPLLFTNATLDVIEKVATDVCVLIKPDHCASKENCTDVCVGVVSEYAVEVLTIATTTVLTPAEICYILTACPKPPTPTPFVPQLRIKSNISDLTGAPAWPSQSLTGSGYFIHVTDIHLDMMYQEGANTKCGEPLCCRSDDGNGSNASNSAGYFGDYACDTSMNTYKSLISRLQTAQPQPDFFIFTGDSPAHDVWRQSRTENLAAITTQAQLLAAAFPNTPIYSCIGNHGAFPVNQYRGPVYDSWLYEPVGDLWARDLTTDAVASLKFGGFYAMQIRKGLVLISMHTTMFIGNDNFWLFDNENDVGGQLVWLADVLAQVEATGQKAIIIGHAAPVDWSAPFQTTMMSLMKQYRSIVLNLFFGHTHDMATWLLHDQDTHEVMHVAYAPGSVTTFTELNPAYRLCAYERDGYDSMNYLVNEFTQFWMDLPAANAARTADWSPVRYIATKEYEMADLSPQSWEKLAWSFVNNTAPAAVVNAYIANIFNGATQTDPLPSGPSVGCDILVTTDAEAKACQAKIPTYTPLKRKC